MKHRGTGNDSIENVSVNYENVYVGEIGNTICLGYVRFASGKRNATRVQCSVIEL